MEKPLWFGKRERPQEDSVDGAENDEIGAEAERQRGHRSEGEAGGVAELAKGEVHDMKSVEYRWPKGGEQWRWG